MKTNISNDQIVTFTKRSHELYRRITEGSLSAEAVLAGLQKLVEGQFPSPQTLAEMIKAGHYDWTNDDITEKKFTVDPSRFTTANTKVYHFNKWMSTEAVVPEMAEDGYEPAFIENLLAYGAENPEEQRKYPIVALGSSCVRRNGHVCSPYLDGDDDRSLNLHWRGCDWYGSYRFLAVRKSAP